MVINFKVFAVLTWYVLFVVFKWPLGASWEPLSLLGEAIGGHVGPLGVVLGEIWIVLGNS